MDLWTQLKTVALNCRGQSDFVAVHTNCEGLSLIPGLLVALEGFLTQIVVSHSLYCNPDNSHPIEKHYAIRCQKFFQKATFSQNLNFWPYSQGNKKHDALLLGAKC